MGFADLGGCQLLCVARPQRTSLSRPWLLSTHVGSRKLPLSAPWQQAGLGPPPPACLPGGPHSYLEHYFEEKLNAIKRALQTSNPLFIDFFPSGFFLCRHTFYDTAPVSPFTTINNALLSVQRGPGAPAGPPLPGHSSHVPINFSLSERRHRDVQLHPTISNCQLNSSVCFFKYCIFSQLKELGPRVNREPAISWPGVFT